jgi:pimeloyl-ACP methyl ester carboxylesterase
VSGIFHQESGTGHPIILLHGFCETSDIWEDFVPRLSDRFRVICPDLPGFGKSKMLDAPFSIADVASAISQWMHELEVRRPVVVGHSLGGYITLALAKKQEEFLAGIGLFHSTALPDSEEKKASRNKTIEFVNRNGVSPFIDTFVPSLFHDKNSPSMEKVKELLTRTGQTVLTDYVAAMRDRPDQSVLVARFSKPLLFLCGENDELISVDTVKKQAKTAQKGTLKILQETGHMGMFESPVRSAREVAQFANSCFQ